MSEAFPTFARWFERLREGAAGASPPSEILLRAGWIATALGAAWAAAGLFYALAAPIGPLGAPPASTLGGEAAVDYAVFDRFEPFFRAPPPTQQTGVSMASLGLTLHALRREGGGSGGAAILAKSGEAQRSYAVGEEISPGIVLHAIGKDHVILRRGAELVQLGFGEPGGGPASPVVLQQGADAGAGVPQTTVAGGMEVDVRAILSAVTVEPRQDGDRISGFVVRIGANAPAVAASGLRDGDVLVSINGVDVRDWEQFEDLVYDLPQLGQASIVVERGGQLETLSWRYGAPAGR